jgi:glycine hydroxymethyltransferase
MQPAFGRYAGAVVENAKALAATLAEAGIAIVSGGTDSHLMLVDLRSLGITGRDAERSLERAWITCNKNGIPFDPQKPTVTSGIRLGSAAATTRGFGRDEFHGVGRCIVAVLRALSQRPADNGAIEARVREEVREMCSRFPIYAELGPRRGQDK